LRIDVCLTKKKPFQQLIESTFSNSQPDSYNNAGALAGSNMPVLSPPVRRCIACPDIILMHTAQHTASFSSISNNSTVSDKE
jgi:hypothetical protein